MSELFCASEALYLASTSLHAVTFITTVVLNLLMTLAIAGKIWVVRRRMNASYTVRAGVEGRIASVVAVLVESAALYAIVGVAVVPEFVGGANAASVLGTLLQCLVVRTALRPQHPLLMLFRAVPQPRADHSPRRAGCVVRQQRRRRAELDALRRAAQ
jgi:hypothetical protein